jgi:hypothetical protein
VEEWRAGGLQGGKRERRRLVLSEVEGVEGWGLETVHFSFFHFPFSIVMRKISGAND